MDHIRLGEDRAASRDGGGFARAHDNVPHVLDIVEQPGGLLIHKRPRARRAIAVGLVVGDAQHAGRFVPIQLDKFGGLAAHLEDRSDVRVERADAQRDGLELVLKSRVESLADEFGSGARDAYAGEMLLRYRLEQLLQHRARGLHRAALDATVVGDEEKPVAYLAQCRFAVGLQEQIVLARGLFKKCPLFFVTDYRQFQTDRADVYAECCHEAS